ncbi:MAG: hypothetical protein QOK28_2641 [Actinomycetota bacterium]|jgi:hypothetical protein
MRVRKRVLKVTLAAVIVAATMVTASAPARATIVANKPTRPASGPGATDYCYAEPAAELVAGATKTYDYWLYRPLLSTWTGGASCTGTSASSTLPLTVIVHGAFDKGESNYGQPGSQPDFDYLAKHLARKGAVVVTPRYVDPDNSPSPGPIGLEGTAIADGYWPVPVSPDVDAADVIAHSVSNALTTIAARSDGRAKVNTSLGMQLIGHSWGASNAFKVAAIASAKSLPPPSSIMAVEAGQMFGTDLPTSTQVNTIPTTTRFACLVGSDDNPATVSTLGGAAGEIGCDRLWYLAKPRLTTTKEFIRVQGDRYGGTDPSTGAPNWLIANHVMMVETPSDLTFKWFDALDFNGTWKIATALMECARAAVHCTYAYGGATTETSMGAWSDTRPANPMIVTTTDPNIDVSSDCAAARNPTLSSYTPCPQYRGGLVEAATGIGDGFEAHRYGMFLDENPLGSPYTGQSDNINGYLNQHLITGYNTENLWNMALVQAGSVGPCAPSKCGHIVVDGIKLRLDWWSDSTVGTPYMVAELSWDLGGHWSPAKLTPAGATSQRTDVLGGSSDNWGHAWDIHWDSATSSVFSELDFNHFLVRLSSQCVTGASCTGVRDYFLDWAPLEVFWHPTV